MRFTTEYLQNLDQSKNRILFDWFSFSSRVDDVNSIMLLLGMTDCKWEPRLTGAGVRAGYASGLYSNGITIWIADGLTQRFSGTGKAQKVSGIWLEMSGEGCRAFEQYGNGDWEQLINYCNKNAEDITVNRVDLAYDDFLGFLDIAAIAEDTRKRNFVSKFRSNPEIKESIGETETAITVSHGRMGSDVYIRIYDKRLEQKAQDVVSHWVRSEIMLRHERAAAAIGLLGVQYDYNSEGVRFTIAPPKQIDELYFGLMNNYLRYILPSDTDTNRWRAPVAPHWEKFCNSIETYRIMLYSAPGTDFSTERLDNYVEVMCVGAVYTYIKLHGVDALLQVCNFKSYKLADKYRQLLADIKDEEELEPDRVYWEEVIYSASKGLSDSDVT